MVPITRPSNSPFASRERGPLHRAATRRHDTKVSELSGSREPKGAILGVEYEFASLERLEVTADGQWQGYSAKDDAHGPPIRRCVKERLHLKIRKKKLSTDGTTRCELHLSI
jgi:hypothetical protein